METHNIVKRIVTKNRLVLWILLFLGSTYIYSLLAIHQLTNDYDGLSEASFHNTGVWELATGRWFWQYISRLRFGTSVDPYTTIITLVMMCTAMVLFCDLLRIKNMYFALVCGLLFLSHPAVCYELTYRFMSPTNGFACLMSVVSIWCFDRMKKAVPAVIIGSVCLAVMMGSYQAYISCSTVVFLALLLNKVAADESWSDILKYVCKSAVGFVAGALEYIAVIKYYETQGIYMSDYSGGSNYSIMNTIVKLPYTLKLCYTYFFDYFGGKYFRLNRMQNKGIFAVMFVLILVVFLLKTVLIFRKNRIKAVVYFALFLLFPLMTMSIFLIATDSPYGLQMAVGPAMFLAAVAAVLGNREADEEGLPERVLKFVVKPVTCVYVLFMAVVMYGSVMQVIIDQNTIYEGKMSVNSMADMILDKLAAEDLLDTEYQYVIYGTPTSNPLYDIDFNAQYANYYALYGAWGLGDNNTMSWRNTFKKHKGVNLNVAEAASYRRLIADGTLNDMTVFPQKGSILMKDGVVYIKLCDI